MSLMAVLKFVSSKHGNQRAAILGIQWMLKWSADSLDTLNLVRLCVYVQPQLIKGRLLSLKSVDLMVF